MLATTPLITMATDISRTTLVASGSPIAEANAGAVSTTSPKSSRLDSTEMVLTVGAMPAGSSRHRTIAKLTPSSLKLSIASIATVATANVPKDSGPSTRASTMPMARVPRRETTVLRKLQPKARVA